MLFADDVILLSDTVVGLQRWLSILEYFCDDYHVEVNTTKTKVVVFKNGGNLARSETWKYRGTDLEVVNGFHYVGLLLTTQMSLNRMVNDLVVKGKKAMVSKLSSLFPYGVLSKTTFLKLFDVKIAPILLYGSELWGTKMYDSLERVHRYAYKRFLNVSFKVCNSFALGDCGRFPLYIQTQRRVLKYWFKLLHLPDHRYVKKAYNMLHFFQTVGQVNRASRVKNMMYTNGLDMYGKTSMSNMKTRFLPLSQRESKISFCKNGQTIFRILLSWFCTSNLNLAFAMNTILILLLYENLGMLWQLLDLCHLE